jgi:hypothetical protein
VRRGPDTLRVASSLPSRRGIKRPPAFWFTSNAGGFVRGGLVEAQFEIMLALAAVMVIVFLLDRRFG